MPIVIKDAGIDIKRIPKSSSETKFTNYLRYKATLLEEFANPCHAPDSGRFCTTSGVIESVKLTATLQKTLNKEIDAQGLPADSPIRGVIDHRGSLLAIARDPEGKILGAIAYTKDDQISTQDFRVLDEKRGTGTKIMQHLAQEALTTKDKEIGLYGAIQSAVPFYQKMGAEFRRETVTSLPDSPHRWFSKGTIKGKELEALAEGTPIDRRVDVEDDDKFDNNGNLTASISEFFNECHSPDTGQFCEVIDITHTDEKPRGGLPGLYTVTAKKDGKDIGYVKLNYRSDIKSANVEELLVHPRHRRQGLASRLMDEALEHFEGYTINHGDRTEEGVKWWETYHKERGLQASLTEFYNSCHAEDGRFCSTHGVTHSIQKAAASDHTAVKQQVADKIANAPVPSAASVKRARALANSSLASQNSADRRRQRENLFNEFGGKERGYVIDHATGVKMHWTNDPDENPNQYPLFERGRIFTERQGGGYQLPNLIPELYDTNRARGDRPIRKENQ